MEVITAPVLQAGLLVPLLVFTLLFRQAAISIFDKPQKVLSLRGAADLDRHDKVTWDARLLLHRLPARNKL